MDFEERLKKAINRGRARNRDVVRQAEQEELSQEELKGRHAQFRLQLSEHIENCLQRLPNHFPGFRYETIYGERGWGGACFRDDIGPGPAGKRANYYSRLEMTVRPHSSYNVVDLAAKGTIRNKEVFSRSHFEEIAQVDPQQFIELIDLWVIEYVELFASSD